MRALWLFAAAILILFAIGETALADARADLVKSLYGLSAKLQSGISIREFADIRSQILAGEKMMSPSNEYLPDQLLKLVSALEVVQRIWRSTHDGLICQRGNAQACAAEVYVDMVRIDASLDHIVVRDDIVRNALAALARINDSAIAALNAPASNSGGD